jgi:hypothetical protein
MRDSGECGEGDPRSGRLDSVSMSSIKRDVKKKVFPRREAEKILVSKSSPLYVSAHRFRSTGFALAEEA